MKKRISKQENQAENSVFDKIKLKLTGLFKPKEKAPEAEKAAEADSKDSNADGAAAEDIYKLAIITAAQAIDDDE